MAWREERKKAQDVFRETNYVFGRKADFETAFPEIEDITVKVNESKGFTTDPGRTRTYRKDTLPGEYVNCSNPICFGGGFSLGEIIREVIRSEETKAETSKICKGYEGSPKGRRKYRECLRWFRVTVSIEYKTKPAP